MAPVDSSVLDAGLQAERTRLAWSRTALSMSVVAALLLHGAGAGSHAAALVPGLLVFLGAATCYLCGVRRYVYVRAAVLGHRTVAQAWVMRLVSALCVLPGALLLVALVWR